MYDISIVKRKVPVRFNAHAHLLVAKILANIKGGNGKCRLLIVLVCVGYSSTDERFQSTAHTKLLGVSCLLAADVHSK